MARLRPRHGGGCPGHPRCRPAAVGSRLCNRRDGSPLLSYTRSGAHRGRTPPSRVRTARPSPAGASARHIRTHAGPPLDRRRGRPTRLDCSGIDLRWPPLGACTLCFGPAAEPGGHRSVVGGPAHSLRWIRGRATSSWALALFRDRACRPRIVLSRVVRQPGAAFQPTRLPGQRSSYAALRRQMRPFDWPAFARVVQTAKPSQMSRTDTAATGRHIPTGGENPLRPTAISGTNPFEMRGILRVGNPVGI